MIVVGQSIQAVVAIVDVAGLGLDTVDLAINVIAISSGFIVHRCSGGRRTVMVHFDHLPLIDLF
ncbi:MAG: hypothetical protein GY934_18950 [Gammaproteobacteria bacterium]|nr:hypothetical protein [Gammaproteobacteria bacterium]